MIDVEMETKTAYNADATNCEMNKTNIAMLEQPLDKLLPQGLQDWLNSYHELNAQTNNIHNEIVNRNENK